MLSQMQAHYGREALTAFVSIVSQARAREAGLVANMQSGAFGPVVDQQLKQARLDAEGARQFAENWNGQAAYWRRSTNFVLTDVNPNEWEPRLRTVGNGCFLFRFLVHRNLPSPRAPGL